MDNSDIRKSLAIVETSQAPEIRCSCCTDEHLNEYAHTGGESSVQSFQVGGVNISIGALGSVTVNGVEYGGSNYSNVGQNTGQNTGQNSAGREITSRGGKNRPAVNFPYVKGTDYFNDLDPNDPNVEVETVDVGQTKIIFYGDGISESYKNAMVRCFNAARRYMEAKGVGWLMSVDVSVKHTRHGVGGYYDYAGDNVWLVPSTNDPFLIHAIIHEFGHRFEYRFPGCRVHLNDRYNWCLQNDPGAFPRDYSRNNFGEFWADCFASWVLGTPLKPHITSFVEHIVANK
jgi:hypothetical protein